MQSQLKANLHTLIELVKDPDDKQLKKMLKMKEKQVDERIRRGRPRK
jgi:hypothetical protein